MLLLKNGIVHTMNGDPFVGDVLIRDGKIHAAAARLDTLFGPGHGDADLVPAMQRVVQAAGRVIRTQSDQGTLFLIDDRFAEPKVQQLLPRWWRLQ